jgi:hypothetical protein
MVNGGFDAAQNAAACATMEREWRRMVSAAARRELAEWHARVTAMASQAATLREAGRWIGGPVDLLSVVGLRSYELIHSAAVAWLLEPTRKHGLGTAFLERVLEHCFPGEAFAGLGSARCEREVERVQGRVDIVVWGEEWALIIENKVYSPEGDGQCDYYYELFCDQPGARFVFLTPTGSAPSSSPLSAHEWRPLGYRDVRRLLRESLSADGVNADASGRGAAEQYLQTLEAMFP